MNEIKIEASLKRSEYLSQLKSKILVDILLGILFSFCAAYLLTDKYVVLEDGLTYSLFDYKTYLIYVAVTFVMFLLLTTGLFFFMMNKEYNSAQRYKKPYTITFSDDVIKINTYNGENHYNYDDVVKVVENKEIYVFFMSKRTGFFLPKRVIEDDTNKMLRDLIYEKIPSKKNKLKKRFSV